MESHESCSYQAIRPASGPFSIALSVLLALSALCPLTAQAEGETGVIISREGNNINVTLDPEITPDVAVYRKGDKMVVNIPNRSRAAAAKTVIDSSLKEKKLLEESFTDKGRIITINSQQVYLINEDLNNRAESSNKTSEKSTAKSGGAPVPGKVPGKPQISIAPITPAPSPKPAESAASRPASPAPASKPVADKPVENKPASEKATATKPTTPLYQPYTPKSVVAQTIDSPPKADSKTSSTLSVLSAPVSQDTAKSLPKIEPTPEPAEAPTDSLEEPISTLSIESSALDTTNPETLPLDLSGKAQAEALQNSTGLMWRVLFSLLAVLGLFAVFAKVLLPRLVERYPQFFQNLQARNQAKLQETVLGEPLFKSNPKEAKAPTKRFFSPAPLPEAESKRQYLEQLQVDGDRFQVITSTNLGGNKELHLVEIRGRQLVVATTPYTVTLIQDLTEPVSGEAPDALDAHISGLLGTGESEGAQPTQEPIETDDYYNPDAPSAQPHQKTHAYIANDPPAIIERRKPKRHDPPSKPFTSKPSLSQSFQESSPADPTYLKYVDPPAPSETQRSRAQQRDIARFAEKLHTQRHNPGFNPRFIPGSNLDQPSQRPPLPYVDAEEVVVLEDYDDMFE